MFMSVFFTLESGTGHFGSPNVCRWRAAGGERRIFLRRASGIGRERDDEIAMDAGGGIRRQD
jgi:hypothetical protein